MIKIKDAATVHQELAERALAHHLRMKLEASLTSKTVRGILRKLNDAELLEKYHEHSKLHRQVIIERLSAK